MRPERLRLDLQHAPPVQLEIAPDHHSTQWYALLQLHHLVCDGQSVSIFISEVAAYLNRADGLPEPIPYRNHVAQALAYACKSDAELFFREKLADIVETTAPYGFMNVHGTAATALEARRELEPALATKLRREARRAGVSAATLFHAAWGLVVSATTGRDDVVYGSVLLGRLQGSAGAQRILGMFINTLPLRLRLRGRTAKQLVDDTQRELVGLLNHEQASLALAQRCSGVAAAVPLFTSLLNYRHSMPDPAREWPGRLGIQSLGSHSWTNYPISVSVDDLGEGFAITAQKIGRASCRERV